jgi:YidC/Oxa1 family membrane protein insertase
MDTRQTLLTVALVYVMFMMWQAWQTDYGQPPIPVTAQTTAQTPGVPAEGGQAGNPTGAVPAAPTAGELPPTGTSTVPAPAAVSVPALTTPAMASGQRIKVHTDLLQVEIDTMGGDIREADLVAYPVAVDKPNDPFPLMTDRDGKLYIAQGGLLGRNGSPKHHTLSHHTTWTAERNDYRLADGQDSLEVPLSWRSDDGLQVTKVFTFHRDSYLVDIAYRINNGSSVDWVGHQYAQFQRIPPSKEASKSFIYTYTGGVLSTPEEPYDKIDFDDMLDEPLGKEVSGGWAAMLQHYFVGALIPNADETNYYYGKSVGDNRFAFGFRGPQASVAAGSEGELKARLFVGPKEQPRLEKAAPNLVLTVDYGYLTIIAEPIYWLLTKIHGIVGNWGWSIIFLTLIIKAMFFHLSATSYKSMAKMRKMQPKLKALKERFGDDRQKMNQAMMDMYKKEKINPLGGCLPIVVQIPVFIALYWVLLESVEMRQAPFMLWINNLSDKDPYFILPVIMGVSMLVQQRLNPTPMDPVQAKVMMVLPLVFTVFFAFFPSGLVLYWVVNNLVSIAQQWYITNKLIKE